MKIGIFCNDGSPLGLIPEDINQDGVGGAEQALFSLAEELAFKGHNVWIFNNPRKPSRSQIHLAGQDSQELKSRFDAFILFRSPNKIIKTVNTHMKLFWSCDQMTIGDYRKEIFPFVDQIVTISQFHMDFFQTYWNAPSDRMVALDLGVRIHDYQRGVLRILGQMIYCSVPDRGLSLLASMWCDIKAKVPGAKLVITGDYTLWGAPNAGTHKHKLQFARYKDVRYLGKVPRAQLVKLQLQSTVQTYPCTYPELFCISAAECQVAGAVPVTSRAGALRTTNEWGELLPGDPKSQSWQRSFVDSVIRACRRSPGEIKTMRDRASTRFSWSTIAKKWIHLFEGGTPSDRIF